MLSIVGRTLHALTIGSLTNCSSGFGCSQALWCVQGPTETVRPVWSVYTDKWGIEGRMTEDSFPTQKVHAKPIFVAYQASDKALLAQATRAGAADSSAGQTSLDETQSQQSDSLSAGTIAGIAIGSAAGGVVIATVLTFLMLRFCFGYRKMHGRGGDDTIQLNASEVDSAARYEMDNSGKAGYLRPPPSQQSTNSTSNELPTEAGRVELASGWKGG